MTTTNNPFDLGRIVATPGLLNSGVDPLPLLQRHANGDWGDVDAEDREANALALLREERLFSVYEVGGAHVYVITEADRSLTTVLLAEEY